MELNGASDSWTTFIILKPFLSYQIKYWWIILSKSVGGLDSIYTGPKNSALEQNYKESLVSPNSKITCSSFLLVAALSTVLCLENEIPDLKPICQTISSNTVSPPVADLIQIYLRPHLQEISSSSCQHLCTHVNPNNFNMHSLPQF